MAKTKFFRVAVEGDTVDGRKIERAHIEQMAATYDRQTYTARINCEHLRGYSPNPPFNAYGSIDAVKTEEITLKIGGKDQKRLALLASFDVNDQAKDLTKADQKVFSSIEIAPNFANSGKAYLFGVALTDTPASLGTEILKFSTRDEARKDNLIALSDDAFTVEFEDAAQDDPELKAAVGIISKLAALFNGAPKEPEAPAPDAKKPDVAPNAEIAAFATQMVTGMETLANALTASIARQDVRLAALSADFATLKGDVEKKPSHQYRARPPATGGGDAMQADC